MIWFFSWLIHFAGVHTERSYGRHFKDDWNKDVGEDEYRCTICKKIFKREE